MMQASDVVQQFRQAARALLKSPAFFFVASVALALGIGASTSVFTVVRAVLLRPLPVYRADRLVTVNSVSVPNFLDWREQSRAFEGMAAYTSAGVNLIGTEPPQRLRAARVSDRFFETLRAQPITGRLFLPDEYKRGGAPVALLSYGLWERQFGKDPALLGSQLNLAGTSYLVAGILPADFQFPERTDLWAPFQFGPKESYNRESNFLSVIARLRDGTRLDQAQLDISAIALRLENQYRKNIGRQVELVTLPDRLLSSVRPALMTLSAAVLFVLLIACTDVANLLLARATARQREMATRVALGASRRRLVWTMLTESLLLALTGAGSGLLLAYWVTAALLRVVSPASVPRIGEAHVDGAVLAFTVALALITGVLFGLVPALHASRTDVNEALKQGGRSSSGGGVRLRQALVVAEIAVATLLVIAAGLSIKAFLKLQNVEPGFDASHVLTMQMNLGRLKAADVPAKFEALGQMVAKTEALPGVESASLVVNLPMDGSNVSGDFHIAGRPDPPKGKLPQGEQRVIGPQYFRTMRIPLVRGREFTTADTEHTTRVTVINRFMAAWFWPGKDPIGESVAVEDLQGNPIWMQIVGVVGDVRQFGLNRALRFDLYIPLRQVPADIAALFLPMTPLSLAVRASGDPAMLASPVQKAVQSVDRAQPVAEIRTMKSIVHDSVAKERLASLLLGGFGAIALLLAVAGIYGVMSYTVTLRSKEIGLRMALGAQVRDIVVLVLRQGLMLAGAGLILGLGTALALTRVLASQLFGVSATDAGIFTMVPVILTVAALMACYVPARRATLVDPVRTLKYE